MRNGAGVGEERREERGEGEGREEREEREERRGKGGGLSARATVTDTIPSIHAYSSSYTCVLLPVSMHKCPA